MKDLTDRDPRTYAIIGAAIEVHKQLGCGFLEPVYQEALAVEFAKHGIPFRREVTLPVFYKEVRLHHALSCRLHLFDAVAVELKALSKLSGTEEAQVINYLKASGFEIGFTAKFWHSLVGTQAIYPF